MSLNFVLGSPAKGQPFDWYLEISAGTRPFAYRHISMTQMGEFSRMAYHDLAGNKPTGVVGGNSEFDILNLMVTPLANLHHKVFEWEGWYANRFGGVCNSLYRVKKTKEVEEKTHLFLQLKIGQSL